MTAVTLITETTSKPTVDSKVEATVDWAINGLLEAAEPPFQGACCPQRGDGRKTALNELILLR